MEVALFRGRKPGDPWDALWASHGIVGTDTLVWGHSMLLRTQRWVLYLCDVGRDRTESHRPQLRTCYPSAS